MLFVLATICINGCGSTEVVMLKLTAGTCPSDVYWLVDSMQIELRTPELQNPGCFNTDVNSLYELQSLLSKRIAFRDLEAGTVSLKLRGFRSNDCRATWLMMCGEATIELPLGQSEVSVPLHCDSSDDFKRCAGIK